MCLPPGGAAFCIKNQSFFFCQTMNEGRIDADFSSVLC